MVVQHIKIVKNQKQLKTIFFAKIVPEYKIAYLRKCCAIKSTGSAINTALFKGG